MQRLAPTVNRSQLLTLSECKTVTEDLRGPHHRGHTLKERAANLAIFQLACGCGLRAGEIAGLNMDEVRTEQDLPIITILAGNAKGGKARTVPAWWDSNVLYDLRGWRRIRLNEHGAGPDDPFICSIRTHTFGQPLNRHLVRQRFIRACRSLGRERCAHLTVHHGRHTFGSLAVLKRSLPEVRDAMGHTSIGTTSCYLHVLGGDAKQNGNLFDEG